VLVPLATTTAKGANHMDGVLANRERIRKILEMRSAGMAYDTIAKTVNTAGIAARKGC
jgi:hypothetical protein